MTNRTLLFGEGLFETIAWKCSEEKLLIHYRRLSSSAHYLGIPCPTYEEFLQEIQKATAGRDRLYVKYLLLSEGGKYLTDRASGYSVLVLTDELAPQPTSVKLGISPYLRHSSDPVCRHKTTSYLFNLLVKKSARERGLWDSLIANEKGHVCETSTANLLFLKGSTLYTPARENGLLWGTTLELLSRYLPVREEHIKLSSVEDWDGIFVLNSLLPCAVVEELEGKRLKVDLHAFEEISRILKACL